jgi:hypothetical protein
VRSRSRQSLLTTTAQQQAISTPHIQRFMTPVLGYDEYALIISCLSAVPPPTNYADSVYPLPKRFLPFHTPEQRATLKNLSLVCKAFAYMARKELVKNLNLSSRYESVRRHIRLTASEHALGHTSKDGRRSAVDTIIIDRSVDPARLTKEWFSKTPLPEPQSENPDSFGIFAQEKTGCPFPALLSQITSPSHLYIGTFVLSESPAEWSRLCSHISSNHCFSELTTLHLAEETVMPAWAFCMTISACPALEALTFHSLQCDDDLDTLVVANVEPPRCRLKQVFECNTFDGMFQFYTWLLSSSSTSLEVLQLEGVGGTTYPDLLHALSIVGPSLKTLRLSFSWLSPNQDEGAIYALCPNLDEVGIHIQLLDSCEQAKARFRVIIDAIQSDCELKKVRVICPCHLRWEIEEPSPPSKALMEVLKEEMGGGGSATTLRKLEEVVYHCNEPYHQTVLRACGEFNEVAKSLGIKFAVSGQ